MFGWRNWPPTGHESKQVHNQHLTHWQLHGNWCLWQRELKQSSSCLHWVWHETRLIHCDCVQNGNVDVWAKLKTKLMFWKQPIKKSNQRLHPLLIQTVALLSILHPCHACHQSHQRTFCRPHEKFSVVLLTLFWKTCSSIVMQLWRMTTSPPSGLVWKTLWSEVINGTVYVSGVLHSLWSLLGNLQSCDLSFLHCAKSCRPFELFANENCELQNEAKMNAMFERGSWPWSSLCWDERCFWGKNWHASCAECCPLGNDFVTTTARVVPSRTKRLPGVVGRAKCAAVVSHRRLVMGAVLRDLLRCLWRDALPVAQIGLYIIKSTPARTSNFNDREVWADRIFCFYGSNRLTSFLVVHDFMIGDGVCVFCPLRPLTYMYDSTKYNANTVDPSLMMIDSYGMLAS